MALQEILNGQNNDTIEKNVTLEMSYINIQH